MTLQEARTRAPVEPMRLASWHALRCQSYAAFRLAAFIHRTLHTSARVTCLGCAPQLCFAAAAARVQNLFTNIHMGFGSRVFYASGDADWGPHSGYYSTFHNLQSDMRFLLPAAY